VPRSGSASSEQLPARAVVDRVRGKRGTADTVLGAFFDTVKTATMITERAPFVLEAKRSFPYVHVTQLRGPEEVIGAGANVFMDDIADTLLLSCTACTSRT
jgi:hypothetical protein